MNKCDVVGVVSPGVEATETRKRFRCSGPRVSRTNRTGAGDSAADAESIWTEHIMKATLEISRPPACYAAFASEPQSTRSSSNAHPREAQKRVSHQKTLLPSPTLTAKIYTVICSNEAVSKGKKTPSVTPSTGRPDKQRHLYPAEGVSQWGYCITLLI